MRSDTFPNSRHRAVGGVSGGTRSVATALPKYSKRGGWWGLMVVGQSEALAERPGLNFRVAVGDEVVQGAKLAERPT